MSDALKAAVDTAQQKFGDGGTLGRIRRAMEMLDVVEAAMPAGVDLEVMKHVLLIVQLTLEDAELQIIDDDGFLKQVTAA